ncbi:pseudouridine synthase [Rhodobacterales bacterium]|nr:pseudouridine synthase [Rhodobacterales bacterium]
MTTRKSSERPGQAKGRERGKSASDKRRPGPRSGKPFEKSDRPKKGAPETRAPAAADSSDRGERIAKVMARAGLCSRREAETWIEAGRVSLNGKVLDTPAVTVTPDDKVLVDGTALPMRERTRLWLYHKPRGLVTTNKDPEGRPTVFDRLPADLPRVLTVGRLDINTEGLLLLTNDGGLARVLELPATGWLRRYRVRAFGKVTQADLDSLNDGIAIDGVLYGAIEATLDKEQGGNVWLTVGLREGKNREVKRVLEHLGLAVNRLIRLSYGPFQLMELPEGDVREIRGRVLRDQLGETLAEEAGADFDAPIFHAPAQEEEKKSAGSRSKSTGPRSTGARSTGQRSQGGQRSEGGREQGGQGKWMSAREGKSETDRRKAAKSDRSDQKKGKRQNEGPRREKVSPRSRFRLTSEPRVRKDYSEERRTPPRRRIWGDEGLVEDKQQEVRGRSDKPDNAGGRGDARRDDRGGARGPRSDRGERGARSDRGERGDRPDRGKRPPRGDKPDGGDRRGGPSKGGNRPRGGGRS